MKSWEMTEDEVDRLVRAAKAAVRLSAVRSARWEATGDSTSTVARKIGQAGLVARQELEDATFAPMVRVMKSFQEKS